jgi:Tfp pilus assembly protein PilO
MALNKREKLLLGVTVSGLFIGGSYLVFMPLIRNWQTLGSKLYTKQKELNGITATISRQPDWQRQYTELRESLGQKSERFQQISDVLKKIEDAGTSSGALFTARRPMQPIEKDVYRELPVQCAFEATTESLVKFLHGLHSGSGFMNVEQLQVSSKPENPGILRCDIQIRALVGKSEGARS